MVKNVSVMIPQGLTMIADKELKKKVDEEHYNKDCKSQLFGNRHSGFGRCDGIYDQSG